MCVCALSRFRSDSLVEVLEAGLTHSHLFLNPELGDSGVFGGALATEDLSTCPAVVLRGEKHHTSTTLTPLSRMYHITHLYYITQYYIIYRKFREREHILWDFLVGGWK